MAIQKFGATEIDIIRAFEKRYHLRLPDDYIQFLLQYNGGIVKKDENCQVFVKSLNRAIHVIYLRL